MSFERLASGGGRVDDLRKTSIPVNDLTEDVRRLQVTLFDRVRVDAKNRCRVRMSGPTRHRTNIDVRSDKLCCRKVTQ